VNFRQLVMFKVFQVARELQRLRLILSVGGLEVIADEIPEQAVVSSLFFRRLKIFRLHVLALCYRAQQESRQRKTITQIVRRNQSANCSTYRTTDLKSCRINNPTLRCIRHTASNYHS